MTPDRQLIAAAERGDLAGIADALSAGADIRAHEDAALYGAAWRGHTEAVRFLLTQGAEASARQSAGAFECAESELREIVEMLVAAGADADALEILELVEQGFPMGGRAPLALRAAAKAGFPAKVRAVLAHGRRDFTPNEIAVAIADAVKSGREESITLLLSAVAPALHRESKEGRIASLLDHAERMWPTFRNVRAMRNDWLQMFADWGVTPEILEKRLGSSMKL